MKKLNDVATEIFLKLVELCDSNAGHIKINNNSSFIAVDMQELETVNFEGRKAIIYSIAHYSELNGDLMAEPEMTFLYFKEQREVYPASFTNHYAGIMREAIFLVDKTWKVWKQEQDNEADFANMWMRNIHSQQHL